MVGCSSWMTALPSGRPCPWTPPGKLFLAFDEGGLDFPQFHAGSDVFQSVLPAAGAFFRIDVPGSRGDYVQGGSPVELRRVFPAALLGKDGFEILFAGAVVQEPIIADLLKPLREDVLEITTYELFRGDCERLFLPAVLAVRI